MGERSTRCSDDMLSLQHPGGAGCAAGFVRGLDDLILRRIEQTFKVRAKGNGNIGCSDPHDRRLQFVEGMFSDSRRDLTCEAARTGSWVHDHEPACFCH